MRTMDTMCASHKYRPPLSAASFYQPDMYARPATLRTHPQSEYRFAGGGGGGSSRGGGGGGGGGARRARLCSAALAVAALVAALAVLAVAALAFYMGALRPDNADPIISFECSLRVTRGDVYGGAPGGAAWRERARRYSAALRALYSASPPPLRAAFAGAHVTGFGDHRLDVYFRLYLDRRKIPSSISNIEEMLKDVLLQDIQSKRSVFGQIKIDPTSIVVKRDLQHTYHSESYMKQAINESMASDDLSNMSQASTKDKGGARMGVIRKTTIKPNTSNKKRTPLSPAEEPEIDTENLPVIQGSFQITKTEADITENKQNEGQTRIADKITTKIPTTSKSPTVKTSSITTTRPKPFTIRSTFNVKTKTDALTTKRIDVFNRNQHLTTPSSVKTTTSTPSTTSVPALISSTTISTSTNQVSQLLLDLLTKENHSKDLPKIDTLFMVPHVIDDEPWKPITKPPSSYSSSAEPKETAVDLSGHEVQDNRRVDESWDGSETEDSVNMKPEERIGVAEVVEDLTAIEGMINSYPTMATSPQKSSQNSDFSGIHNSDPNLAADIYVPKPLYTSFTHPTISPAHMDTETLGSNYPKAHPIPVDIIGSVVEDYFNSNSHVTEDDGKPIMRPPKDKVSTIEINVMHPDFKTEATDIVDVKGGSIIKKTNETISNKSDEALESRIDENDSEENTERYLRRDSTKKTPLSSFDKHPLITSTPHYTWELVNTSTKVNDQPDKKKLQKYFNDTLQAIITKSDTPFPITTPKYHSRGSLLKNITDIISKFTSGSQPKTNPHLKPEKKKEDEGPDINNYGSTSGSIKSSTIASPIITLMPAKSNLGINRPLRPRPKPPAYNLNYREDVRSFSEINVGIPSTTVNVSVENQTPQTTTFEITTQPQEHSTEMVDFNYPTDTTTPALEIITSVEGLDATNPKELFFLTNVTDTIKVVADSLSSTNNSKENNQESRLMHKSITRDKPIEQPIEAERETIESTTDFFTAESSEELSTQKIFFHDEIDQEATFIPEGTYKISYHVSGSVSSKTANRTKSLPTYNIPLDPDIVLEIPVSQSHQLSAEKLKQLANLATISDSLNNTFIQVDNSPGEDVISHKAVSSSYTVNHAGINVLTKTFNKVLPTKDDEKNYNKLYTDITFKDDKKTTKPDKKDECNITASFRCDTGQCLPMTSKCNRLFDCPEGEDENTCTCADYLRSEFLSGKICDGVVDCWDFSDENTCEWCSPDQFVCANARQCIEHERVCDGTPDCPLGDDERACVTLAEDYEDNAVVPYNEEGYLMVRKRGVWGRLCVQNFEKVIKTAHSTLQLTDLGRAVCKAMTFEESEWVRETREPRESAESAAESAESVRRYWEVWHNPRPRSGETRLSFRRASCPRRRALRVRCASLHCGLKPFVDTQQARYERRESAWVRETREPRESAESAAESAESVRRYWEVWHNPRPRSGETRLSFRRASCPRRRALRVRCASLHCGLKPFVDTQQARIVGGTGAAAGAWPWQAALYRDGDFQCGATLIAPAWLLSASHCFYQATDAHWVARLGALRRGAWPRGPWEVSAPVVRVHVHPQYAPRGFRNDIALVRVPRLRAHARLRPACLPPARAPPPAGTLCTVLGWGQLYELGRVFPDTLQEVELPVISTAECKRRTLFLPLYKVTDDMFCAGYERGGRDACLGDSGGPLMCQESDNRWYLHGVTSNGYGCARANRPGVYTKVANYIDWIDSVMQQYADEDAAPAPNVTDYSDLDVAENRGGCRGHRCPLGECLPPSSVCNGYLECSDGSDERHCHPNT